MCSAMCLIVWLDELKLILKFNNISQKLIKFMMNETNHQHMCGVLHFWNSRTEDPDPYELYTKLH